MTLLLAPAISFYLLSSSGLVSMVMSQVLPFRSFVFLYLSLMSQGSLSNNR